MKLSFKLGLATLLLANGAAQAINPVQGWYGGMLLGVSYSSSLERTFANPFTGASITGDLTYKIFGDIAGQVGYRFNHFRAEGELLLNSNPYKELTIGRLKFTSPSSSTGLRMKGQTNTGAFLVNGFYDFMALEGTSSFGPYVGLGLGYAYVNNGIKFYENNVLIPGSNVSKSKATPAGQIIIGASYFLDDFTAFSLDFRFLTMKAAAPSTARQQVGSVNLGFNGAFDCM